MRTCPVVVGLAVSVAGLVCGEARGQFAPSINARSWIEGEGSSTLFGTSGGEAVGGEFSIPYPSPDYAVNPASAVVYFNADATANRLRNSYFIANSLSQMFLWNSMVDTYTISGPPGSEGMPVGARVVFRASGTLFVGPTNGSNHVGGVHARIEMGTWGASADPAFPEDFRVSPFDTSGRFLKSFSSGGSQNYGTTQPEFPFEIVIDQVLTRTVGTPFDVAFGLDTTRSGAGNVRGVPNPTDEEFVVATIDWELPEGYTITSVLGWTDPDGPSPFCRDDFNGDGDVGTDADIEAFFACLGGSCCAACGSADFNGDGDIGTDADIESFFRVMGGGAC